MIIKKIVLMMLMIAAAIMALYLKPTHKIASDQTNFVLESIIPSNFGDWKMVQANIQSIVNPQQNTLINKLYSQTLSRTYVNKYGEQIMLVIAYGEDQSDSKQLHYPEVCYPAQGFQVISINKGLLTTENGQIRVKRLVAVLQQRTEPITYWTTVGNKVVLGGRETKLEQLKYGFHGDIPDGLLFRVSSITNEIEHGYKVQADFVSQLLKSISPSSRYKLAGLSDI